MIKFHINKNVAQQNLLQKLGIGKDAVQFLLTKGIERSIGWSKDCVEFEWFIHIIQNIQKTCFFKCLCKERKAIECSGCTNELNWYKNSMNPMNNTIRGFKIWFLILECLVLAIPFNNILFLFLGYS